MIGAIIFDIDGTLLDSFEANLFFYQNLMKTCGYRPPTREEYTRLLHKTMRDTIQSLTGSTDSAEIERIWNLGHDPTIKSQRPMLPEGTEEALKKLFEKYPLGIATSRLKIYTFEPPLDSLKKYFGVAVSYEDTEHHKPDPEPLLLAAKQLGVDPKKCVYVGDAETDLQSARAALMKFVLFIYGSQKLEGADSSISNFKDLPKVIELLAEA